MSFLSKGAGAALRALLKDSRSRWIFGVRCWAGAPTGIMADIPASGKRRPVTCPERPSLGLLMCCWMLFDRCA